MTVPINVSFVIGFLEFVSQEKELSAQLVEIVKSAQTDLYCHTLIYVSHKEEEKDESGSSIQAYNADSISKHLANQLELPVIHLRELASFYMWPCYNRRIIALVSLKGDESKDKKLLQLLWKTLRRNVKTRLLLLAKADESIEYLEKILQFCCDHKSVNVVAVRASLVETGEFYGPQIYPGFRLNKQHVTNKAEDTIFYPNHVKNMHRHALRLAMKATSNNVYILRTLGDDTILGGYVGHFFTEFSRKHNVSLTFPSRVSDLNELFVLGIDKLVQNGTYDVSTEPSFNLGTSDMVYSTAYDFVDWCLMVPVEKPIPAYMFYVIIYDAITLTLILVTFVLFSLTIGLTYWTRSQPVNFRNLILNVYIINGLLGQSYKMEPSFTGVRSVLYMLICVAGLMFNTTYVTYLQSYMTRSPTEPVIKTLDEIRASGMRIAVYKQEFMVLETYGVADRVKPIAKIIPTSRQYQELRGSYDTRYVYPVPSIQWSVYNEQQKFFKKARFRLSDICLYKMIGLSIPLQENSIYEDAVNTMIRQSIQGGLIQHWRSLSFLEAVQRKRISLMDVSTATTFEPMKVEDLKFLISLLALMLILNCFCFIVELYWTQRSVNSKKLILKLCTFYHKDNI